MRQKMTTRISPKHLTGVKTLAELRKELPKKSRMPNSEVRTIKIKYEHVEESVIAHLYAMTVLNDNEDVIFLDMGLPIDTDGMVELEIEVVRA